MYLVKSLQQKKYNVSFCMLKVLRKYSVPSTYTTFEDPDKIKDNEIEKNKLRSDMIYNSVLAQIYGKRCLQSSLVSWREKKHKAKMFKITASTQPLPIALKYLVEDAEVKKSNNSEVGESDTEKVTQFPFHQKYDFYSVTHQENEEKETKAEPVSADVVNEEIRKRYKVLKMTKDWMTAYDNFEDDLLDEDDTAELNNWTINYGTPDPNSKISNIPCGGCGALLHCKDASIPGYIPSEIFRNVNRPGSSSLEAIICQRCYFLKEHNLALQVQVSPEDYPKILQRVVNKQTLVILLVDLTDFPCSIWPGIADILGPKTPILIVGNKIDLLPKDSSNFLNNIKSRLLDELKLHGFGTINILDVKLISAKSGFGVEELINSMHIKWGYKGDVYLVGCTNVGKSSLFNTLLQSDYCKMQAVDVIQRATISQLPGTTLNLLKFPILRPSKYRLFLRTERIKLQQKLVAAEGRAKADLSKRTNDIQLATPIGHIGRTFIKTQKEIDRQQNDLFSVKGSSQSSGKFTMGINEEHPDFVMSKWCYDTPGVVQADQILNILTIDELMITIPRQLITPETFCVKPGMTLYIAGLARFDYLEGPTSVRLTVFRSNELPITVCSLEKADEVYNKYLGTEYFKVPINEGDRFSKWPGLSAKKPISITGVHPNRSCKDVVLSSAGWVAINCNPGQEYKFQAWTPEQRGIYVRDCLLPFAVKLRGPRVKWSITYKGHKFMY